MTPAKLQKGHFRSIGQRLAYTTKRFAHASDFPYSWPMEDFDVTFANYRCFSSDQPAYLKMRQGMTAIVGPNNCGKSSLLRFFHEFREVFRTLSQRDVRKLLPQNGNRGFSFLNVGDPSELHFNGNQQGMRIELRIQKPKAKQLSGVIFQSERQNPSVLKSILLVGPEYVQFEVGGNSYPHYRIGNEVFEASDSRFESFMHELASARYFPATRVTIGESQGEIYDLQFGSRFINQWDAWKTGNNRVQNEAIQRVTEEVARVFGFERLEISATPDKRDLHVVVNGRPFKLRELGSGIAQFVLVLANLATNRASWLLIDEPEISLHPSLQLDYLTSISQFVECGILFATHSVGLARSADRTDLPAFFGPFLPRRRSRSGLLLITASA